MRKKALFIVFEGIEGCGKSYQSHKLYLKLKKKKIPVIKTREPGGTKTAELIRNLILKDYFNNGKQKFDKYTDTLLYLASRNEHIKNMILPAMKSKKIVICDRFIDSTFAYQVYGKKVKKNFIKNIHKMILRGIKPDITFLLTVDINKSIKRLKRRKVKNRYDKFSKNFYVNAQKNFLKISKNKRKYYVLDSTNDDKNLENKIFQIVMKQIS